MSFSRSGNYTCGSMCRKREGAYYCGRSGQSDTRNGSMTSTCLLQRSGNPSAATSCHRTRPTAVSGQTLPWYPRIGGREKRLPQPTPLRLPANPSFSRRLTHAASLATPKSHPSTLLASSSYHRRISSSRNNLPLLPPFLLSSFPPFLLSSFPPFLLSSFPPFTSRTRT